MTYATQDDLVPSVLTGKVLIQLTDDTGSGVADVDVVSEALLKASGLVDSYCRARYSLPLQPTEELKDLTCSIAVYKLYSRRTSTTMPPVIKDNYQDSLSFLKAVAASKVSLDQPITPDASQGTAGTVVKSRRKQVFGDRNLSGFSS